jgi:hypothetical protein
VGTGNPSIINDIDFFYAATSVTIGNRKKAPLWEAPWLDERKLKEIASLIFKSLKV